MLLNKFGYIITPQLTNDLQTDIKNLHVANGKQDIYIHAQRVAVVIAEISDKFNLDRQTCILSAYCHDIGGIIKAQDMLEYARNHNLYLDEAEEKYPFLLHQRFSAMIAEEVFKIKSERILSSITHHTTLKADPSQYDMALFVADKLSWDQDGVPPFYEIVKSELDKSLYHASFAYIEFMLKNNQFLSPHKWLRDAHDWLSESRMMGHI